MKNKSLSERIRKLKREHCRGKFGADTFLKEIEKDVKETIQRIKEELKDYINWLNSQFQCASYTHKFILKKIDKVFDKHLGGDLR